MRRTMLLLAVTATSLGLAACGSSSSSSSSTSGGAAAATSANPTTASLVITHIVKGCHTFMSHGVAGKPAQTVRLAPGGTLQITNNDVMPHVLSPVSAAGATIASPDMGKPGAKSTMTFAKAGTYTFKTKAGEDYTKGVKTVGADNQLKVKVIVA